MKSFEIACHSVNYRQGFIEVSKIHPGLVNLETWEIHPDIKLAGVSRASDQIANKDFTANTELELTPAQARALAAALVSAAEAVEQ